MSREELLNPRDRLPRLSLPVLGAGSARPVWVRGRRATVVAIVHGGACDGCRGYLRRLAAQGSRLTRWNDRILVALAGDGAADDAPAPDIPSTFIALSDREGTLGHAVHMTPPALLVADQWAQIHFRAEAGPAHRWPPVGEVIRWLDDLAMQCPECEGEAF